MEDELKCPFCKNYFNNAVLLPCFHSLCFTCVIAALHSNGHTNNTNGQLNGEETAGSEASSCCNVSSSSASSETSDVDKLSLLSETDSGVICTSRPNSYVGTPNIQTILFPPLHNLHVKSEMQCPVCSKVLYIDESSAHSLPKNKVLQSIVEKYEESKSCTTHCQLCERNPKEAVFMCEQCEVFYCESCRESCHPFRGPLAKHTLINPQQGKTLLRCKSKSKDWSLKCVEHSDQTLSNFCLSCKVALCSRCLQEDKHATHDMQSLAVMCKSQKTELSQTLQTLSEKAKSATEYIQRLKSMNEKVNDSSTSLEREISTRCDLLIDAIQNRKHQLLDFILKEKEYKLRALKEQVSSYTNKLQQTTGLLQFCIEALKETEATAFLQIGASLINRVNTREISWNKELSSSAWICTDFELSLDCRPVLTAIEQMTFAQMKPPEPPILIVEECVVENNSITIAWKPQVSNFVEGFILEFDDGNDGPFREVYCGKESVCTVDGLHFGCNYRCRVKAFNSRGESKHSEVISLQTPDVAWFAFNPVTSSPEIRISNDKQTATCEIYENRLVLGNIGFSRGVHYWEITIDRYDGNADPAFGIAKCDVANDKMLGKDSKGWSMYIDNKRSWFLHGDHHDSRTEGGISTGSVVGVLLDLESRELSFFVNDEKQGPTAFTDLRGVFYPAVSLNRNVQITIHTALDPPNIVELDSQSIVGQS